MSVVTVIDYGVGNLLSVRRSLEHCGAEVKLTSSPAEVLEAGLLVLPGVGAFQDGMRGLEQRNLIEPIREYSASGRPMLGICLGMQMLLDASEEFGEHKGLGIISGRVLPISSHDSNGQPHKIPHIGWNELLPSDGGQQFLAPLLSGIPAGSSAYFVHSFNAVPDREESRVADCYYGGIRIAATIRAGNTYGCQFHPEKSGAVGLAIVRNFLSDSMLK